MCRYYSYNLYKDALIYYITCDEARDTGKTFFRVLNTYLRNIIKYIYEKCKFHF